MRNSKYKCHCCLCELADRKGECGRIAIFGGCMLYTGAACYAGLAALRTGADTVHVFCDAAAAAVIRAFSCELVVHPVLDQVTVV